MDMNSLAHTTWECKYHIVFAPKFRRKVIYKQIRADVGKILSDLCKRKGIEIIAAEACPDHVHMFVRIPPKYSVSEVMGYLKGKSSLMIFDRHRTVGDIVNKISCGEDLRAIRNCGTKSIDEIMLWLFLYNYECLGPEMKKKSMTELAELNGIR